MMMQARPSSLSLTRTELRTKVTAHRVVSQHRNLCQPPSASSSEVVYQGIYGPWKVDKDDLFEVFAYRAGLTAAAVTTAACSVSAVLPPDSAAMSTLDPLLNPLCLLGAAGMGVSLYYIHIYVTPLKRALQSFWALGTLGGIYLMATQDTPAALFVAEHNWGVWLVGPLFASVTGVAFKEGLCYGKAEAAGLFFATPLLLGGHLTGILPEGVQLTFLAAYVTLFGIFAARKFTQLEKDDIGDKSVFMFQAMSEREQVALVDKLKSERGNDTLGY